ncbi:MAG: hypothetical protein ACTSRD_00765, partial [Promethearchaeota archaeon]
SQIWAKNDTANDVTAVVGVSVIKFSEDVFSKKLPSFVRTLLALQGDYGHVKTYWDLLVAFVTEAAEVTDISDQIRTTDGSIEFNPGGGAYFILSKDAEFLIFSYGFEISNDWIVYVAEHTEDVKYVFDEYVVFMATFLAAFQIIVELLDAFDGGIPTPEASSDIGTLAQPTGTPTSTADVQFVTAQIGSLYGSSALLWIILGVVGGVVVVGGIILLVRRKRK